MPDVADEVAEDEAALGEDVERAIDAEALAGVELGVDDDGVG